MKVLTVNVSIAHRISYVGELVIRTFALSMVPLGYFVVNRIRKFLWILIWTGLMAIFPIKSKAHHNREKTRSERVIKKINKKTITTQTKLFIDSIGVNQQLFSQISFEMIDSTSVTSILSTEDYSRNQNQLDSFWSDEFLKAFFGALLEVLLSICFQYKSHHKDD